MKVGHEARRGTGGLALAVIWLIGLAFAPPASSQTPPLLAPEDYCVAENRQYDPRDLARPNAPPIELPPGFVRHRIAVAGFNTTVIERGPTDAGEAVVLMHGIPGSSLDFLGILRAMPPGVRVIAFDVLGFGAADKPYDFPYDFASGRVVIDRAFEELGLERVHLLAHDAGSVITMDWAARHPENLASATMIAGGALIGYTDHHFARIWKTPRLGEQMMYGTDRESFVNVLQLHNPRPLPREFIDRNYDYFDRATRCAVLKLYRAMPDLSDLGREHAEALRPYDRPALVIWGDRDPFLPAYLAESNREAFPRADIHIFENSGHWPFVDTEERAVRLIRDFLGKQVSGGRAEHGSAGGHRCKSKKATLIGTPENDVLTGTPARDVIAALGGRDTVSGLAGKDLICGGRGKDTLRGGKGKDKLYGQKGKDRLRGGGGKDRCVGGKKDDSAKKCEIEKSI